MVPLPEGIITSTIGMEVWALASIVEVLNLSLFGYTSTSTVFIPVSIILLSSVTLNPSSGCHRVVEVVTIGSS